MDNEAAKKIVQKIENQRRKAEAMERVAKEGLKALLSDIRKRADISKEIKHARSAGSTESYEAWVKKYNTEFGQRTDLADDFTGYNSQDEEY